MQTKLEASIPMEIIDQDQLETRQEVQLDIIADRDGAQICIIEDGLASYYAKIFHDARDGFHLTITSAEGATTDILLRELD